MATTLQVEPPHSPMRRRRWALGLGVAARVVALAWPVASHVRALTYGRTVGTLRPGAASVVIRADGSATAGQWGRDVSLRPDVVAVRQNLDLIVDKGRPVDALADDVGNRWGTTKNQVKFTWRSGLGVDALGNLVYVGGANLNLVTLANALVQAGVVRGMQLDIRNEMVAFVFAVTLR